MDSVCRVQEDVPGGSGLVAVVAGEVALWTGVWGALVASKRKEVEAVHAEQTRILRQVIKMKGVELPAEEPAPPGPTPIPATPPTPPPAAQTTAVSNANALYPTPSALANLLFSNPSLSLTTISHTPEAAGLSFLPQEMKKGEGGEEEEEEEEEAKEAKKTPPRKKSRKRARSEDA